RRARAHRAAWVGIAWIRVDLGRGQGATKEQTERL
ncbi:MAG: hypothetical protein ACI9MR_003843, partial [Myxococcota bacterium]